MLPRRNAKREEIPLLLRVNISKLKLLLRVELGRLVVVVERIEDLVAEGLDPTEIYFVGCRLGMALVLHFEDGRAFGGGLR